MKQIISYTSKIYVYPKPTEMSLKINGAILAIQSILFFTAYKYADLGALWLALSIVCVLLSIYLFSYSRWFIGSRNIALEAVDEINEEMNVSYRKPSTAEVTTRKKLFGKIAALIFSLILLYLWGYSWRNLFV